MSKRKAATDLNHDNWDREEEPEVAGKFQEAHKEVVEKRVIRTAKRRLQAGAASSIGGGSSNEAKKLFSGFSGFGTTKSSANPTSVSEMAKNSFSFLKKSDTPLNVNSSPNKPETNEKYLAKLKGLNEAVLDWIKQHVDSNPCCILTPVFRDYDNYLKEMQNENDISSNSGENIASESAKQTPTFGFIGSSNNSSMSPVSKSKVVSFSLKESEKSVAPSFSFGSKEAGKSGSLDNKDEQMSKSILKLGSSESSEKTPSSGFTFLPTATAPPTFGLLLSNDKKKPAPDDSSGPPMKKLFSFGNCSSDKAPLDIKFPSVPPGGNFTFSGINKVAESSDRAEIEDADDEEPKPEQIKLVTEDDALYTKRVKVFVKKGENYADLGVGNLFVKEAPNGWHQVIVRNDTSLGNIIFNILLSSQHPTKRLGKNNVMIVCQPTPQHTGPAVPVLLRVKTSEDADQLLETIDKYKKK